jgi:hypothetical protein
MRNTRWFGVDPSGACAGVEQYAGHFPTPVTGAAPPRRTPTYLGALTVGPNALVGPTPPVVLRVVTNGARWTARHCEPPRLL